MLHGVTKGDLKLTKNINKYLDLCLKCGKCNKFCPSEIDVCQIVHCAKYEYEKNKLSGKLTQTFQSNFIFNTVINIGKILSKPFRPIKQKAKTGVKVIYFKGCVNQIFPHTDRYLNKIFKNKLEIVEPNFECCGLPFLSEGNMKRFISAAKNNIKKFRCDFDYVATDCASCEFTLLQYPKYLNEDFDIPLSKFVNWGVIIADKNIKFEYKKPIKVTFHKPCHLKDDRFFEYIIQNNCKNVEYVKCEDYDACCGFAGSFAIKNPDEFNQLSRQKAINIDKTNAHYLITTCPSCTLGLKYALKQIGSKTKVMSLLEFLSKGVA